MTIDEAIDALQEIKEASKLGGNTVLVLCIPDVPYLNVDDITLDEDEDGAVVLLVSDEEVY